MGGCPKVKRNSGLLQSSCPCEVREITGYSPRKVVLGDVGTFRGNFARDWSVFSPFLVPRIHGALKVVGRCGRGVGVVVMLGPFFACGEFFCHDLGRF